MMSNRLKPAISMAGFFYANHVSSTASDFSKKEIFGGKINFTVLRVTNDYSSKQKKMTNASSPLLQMISDRIRSEKVNSLLTNGILIALDRPDSGPDIIAACVAGLVDNFPDVSKILGEEITAEIVGLPEFKIGLMIESAANKYSTAVGANDETRIWKSFFDFKAGVSWAGQNLCPRWIDAAKSTPLRFDIEIAVTMIHENDASGDRPTKAFTKYSAATGWDVAAGWTVITWLYDIDHL